MWSNAERAPYLTELSNLSPQIYVGSDAPAYNVYTEYIGSIIISTYARDSLVNDNEKVITGIVMWTRFVPFLVYTACL